MGCGQWPQVPVADVNIVSNGEYSLTDSSWNSGKLGWSRRPVLEASETSFTLHTPVLRVVPLGTRE